MPRRGYPLEGPRAGGISRLAEDAGIPQSTMSRLVNGKGEPTPDTLRRIGKVLGCSLGEMMVHAGLAEPNEVGRDDSSKPDLHVVPDFQVGLDDDPDPRDAEIQLRDGTVWRLEGLRDQFEMQIWMITNLPGGWQARARVIKTMREEQEDWRAARRPPEPKPQPKPEPKRENGTR